MAEYSSLFARIDLALSQHSQPSEREPASPTPSQREERCERQRRPERATINRSVDIVQSGPPHTEQRARPSSKRARVVEQPCVTREKYSHNMSSHAGEEHCNEAAEWMRQGARLADDADDEMEELRRCGLLD